MMMTQTNASTARPESGTGAGLPNPPVTVTHSSALLRNDGTLHIAHHGAIYTLRATRNGGLILTK